MFANCSDSRSGSDSRGGGGVDFLAGFLLGSAVVGALAYVYAPQVSVYIYIYGFGEFIEYFAPDSFI